MIVHICTCTNTYRLQNCEHFITDGLIKSWDAYIIGERSTVAVDSTQKDVRAKSLTGTLWPGSRISKKRKGLSVSSETMVQVTLAYHRVGISRGQLP